MMLNTYLVGAVEDAIARARQLVEIAQDCKVKEMNSLRQICVSQLKDAIFKLVGVARALSDHPSNLGAATRVFQAMVAEIDEVERVGCFALKNPSDEDVELNRVLTAICGEIGYPLLEPTVSHTSQGYFEISTKFNLLRVPLIEGRFFLHLPDLYHELCHPMLAPDALTTPKLDPLRQAFLKQKISRGKALDEAILRGERRRSVEELGHRYGIWRRCWMEAWMEEFFCDAFGAFTAGPSYGWSHLHLCVRRDLPLYDVPHAHLSSHPANHARMFLILTVLELRSFAPEAEAITRAWAAYAERVSDAKPQTYDLCYPPETLKRIAEDAVSGFQACGLQGLPSHGQPLIGGVLQDAWQSFWTPTTDYGEWEVAEKEKLQASLT